MTVDFAYKLVQFIANKSQMGNITPSQFNLIINEAQNEYLSFLLGNVQQYQYTRPQPRVGLGNNQLVRQKLVSFIYQIPLTIDVTGYCEYPTYFIQVDAMWKSNGTDRVRFVEQDRLYSVVNSSIDAVEDYPIYLLETEGFRFYPNNLGAAKLSYVKRPTQIVWGYTTDGNGRPVYNPSTSVDPMWDDIDMIQIIVRALRMIGVNLQDANISQYAEQIKTQGQ